MNRFARLYAELDASNKTNDKVAAMLRKRGVDAVEIHGDLRQKRREQILKRFREGNVHILVATDLVGRGLDIRGVSHIFNS